MQKPLIASFLRWGGGAYPAEQGFKKTSGAFPFILY